MHSESFSMECPSKKLEHPPFPIGSTGLLYLPTFTNKNQLNVGKIYHSHGSYGFWIVNFREKKTLHGTFPTHQHITFRSSPSQPTHVIPLAMSPVLVASQASSGLLVFVDPESVQQNQEHWKHRSELPLSPATRPTRWDPQWPAEDLWKKNSTTIQLPSLKLTWPMEIHHFDDIYQERCGFSWAMLVSGRVTNGELLVWVGDLGYLGSTYGFGLVT